MDFFDKEAFELIDIFDMDEDDSVASLSVFSDEEVATFDDNDSPDLLPILPLRNSVLLPGVIIPITLGRQQSLKLIHEYEKKGDLIGVITQKNKKVEEPDIDDLFTVGTYAKILKVFKLQKGLTTVLVQGRSRFILEKIVRSEPYIVAKATAFPSYNVISESETFNVMVESVRNLGVEVFKFANKSHPSEFNFTIKNIKDPIALFNSIIYNLDIVPSEKQRMCEIVDALDLGQELYKVLNKERQIIDLKRDIEKKVKVDMDKQQRDYILNQQIKAIQEELGDKPGEQEIEVLQKKAKDKKWSKEIATIFQKELNKLRRMNSQAAEYSIQINYLETMVDLPWNEYTKDNFNLKRAQKILDNDHFGLKNVKERIIEHLAVYKLKGDMKSPILCLVGPPGVGKTSLGRSVAQAIGRKYVRMSLGGVRDEAELRGHRKTYIGAMPGRILQNIKKAGSSNPVFILDELDKVSGNNINGDPQAALLEILDPEQNNSFYDNFLEVDFDLSKIMFIATANTVSTIHPALRDRMEIIDVSGYLTEEKIEIAKKHLIPKQFEAHGVSPKDLSFSKSVITKIIEEYTRESGVRSLEQKIAKILRNRAKYIVTGDEYSKVLKNEDLKDILGYKVFQREAMMNIDRIGVVIGLAWTSVGGEILFIEASKSQGKGNLSMTGNLGDVMKESATLALEYIKANVEILDIDPEIFEKINIHIHVPEGATPKDGPSAGITLFTALVSILLQKKVYKDIAMTGEITLRGRVLPVGGIKEKILAAKRSGVKKIIMSKQNEKDLFEIEPQYIEDLEFVFINNMKDVLQYALID